ncbi:dienelactone hydrolase family protein [Sphingomonas sp. Root710]|uniref:dienelactone hydrolase family protein n=1 Tax=Sphingomonas sp. Root710 TaxID=1736594 RepID=UPI000ADF2439|nr:dienelactone hydrolase family protein [Sphingomonas sp. Root710]
MTDVDIPLAVEPLRLCDGFVMDVLVDRPADAPKAAILLLSPIFGVDEIFARTMRNWSRAGYLAVAPDYFARVFPGPIQHSDEGFQAAIGRVKAVDRRQMLLDLREVGAHFQNAGPLFIGGYCAGGEPALQLALQGFGDAYVIFHAARLGLYADRLAGIDKPLDIHFGGADPLVPMEEVERIRAGAAGKSDIRITVHPDAAHGFTQQGSRNFQAAAAAASFEAARDFFASRP